MDSHASASASAPTTLLAGATGLVGRALLVRLLAAERRQPLTVLARKPLPATLSRDPRLTVHLLAAVEPRVSGKVRIFMSPECAQAALRDAAQRWLAPLEAMLAAAGVPCTSEIVVGPTWAAIREASSRPDIDRVLLPVKRHSWRGWREHSGYALHSPHRVTLVA